MAKDKSNTPQPAARVPAPDTTQEQAGAGETQDKQSTPTSEPVVTHFHVAARTDGFRRCGRAWPAAGITIAVEDLAEGDIERLFAERELVVTPIAEGVA